ncbi:MAG: ABC transporter permease [Acidimicrobiales bacterium]
MSIFTIARADLLRGLRSRSAIITSFVAPLAMAIVFGLMFSSSGSASFTIGLVDVAGSPISGQIVDSMVGGSDDQVTFTSIDSVAAAETAVEDDDVGAAIVFEAADGAPGIGLRVIETPASPLSSQVAQSIASSVATSIETGGRPPVELADLTLGGRELSAPVYFGASMAILLLFFSTGMAAQSILEDRQSRTLDRILSGPTTIWSVLIGKVLAVAVLAVLGFMTVWIVTTLLFGANWGSPPAVFILIVATVVALAGVATFVGGFAKTPQQASTLTAVVTFGLSLLGGNFTGPADAPAALRALRSFTPNGRALEAFTRLSVDAVSFGSIAVTIVALIGFGVVFGAVGLVRLRQTVGT